ncbi:MAG: hypothetical protein N2327_07945 [Caldimicrobium sp.]|nr:hypothetical protein [Caldimicrobium sp.]
MGKSYVEEIVVRYLIKEGYLVLQNIWFKPKESESDKKTQERSYGWSDIDIFAVKPGESPLIIQCKSFTGTESADEFINSTVAWFEQIEKLLKNPENFLSNPSLDYRGWCKDGNYKKVLVVDILIQEKEVKDKLEKKEIKVCRYEDILIKLLIKLQEELEQQEEGRIGKEEDILLRVFLDMIRRTLIDNYKIQLYKLYKSIKNSNCIDDELKQILEMEKSGCEKLLKSKKVKEAQLCAILGKREWDFFRDKLKKRVEELEKQEKREDFLMKLLMLTRWRMYAYNEVMKLLYKEVTQMETLMPLVIDKERDPLYNEGRIKEAQEMVLEVVEVNLGEVPKGLEEQIKAETDREKLKKLHRELILASNPLEVIQQFGYRI